MVTGLSFRPLHDVLLADDFLDASAGVLPNTPPNPRAYQRGYVDGEYMVRIENAEEVASVATKDEYTDATIAVDAHTAEDTPASPGLALLSALWEPSIWISIPRRARDAAVRGGPGR